jgi:hypothetical protein
VIFFGDKQLAWFDVWSLEHFIAGVGISHLCALLGTCIFQKSGQGYSAEMVRQNPRPFMGYILMVALLWEVIEFYLEAGYTGIEAVTYWFQGVEFWGNRIITDPLLVLLGGYVGLMQKKLIWWARGFSVTWLYVHIFIFPHCMYLHVLMGLE